MAHECAHISPTPKQGQEALADATRHSRAYSRPTPLSTDETLAVVVASAPTVLRMPLRSAHASPALMRRELSVPAAASASSAAHASSTRSHSSRVVESVAISTYGGRGSMISRCDGVIRSRSWPTASMVAPAMGTSPFGLNTVMASGALPRSACAASKHSSRWLPMTTPSTATTMSVATGSVFGLVTRANERR